MVAVVKADSQCLAAVGIVVITAAVAAVYSSHTTIGGGMTPTAIAAAARGVGGRGILQHHRRRGGKGRDYSPTTAVVGGMTPNAVAAAARGVVGTGIHMEISNGTHKLHHVKRSAVFQNEPFTIPYCRINHLCRHWNKRMLTIVQNTFYSRRT
jgi:hypothetical protein